MPDPVGPAVLSRRPRSVSGDVGAYLERFIATTLKPGGRLPPERELAATLGVSRTTVREAMRDLEIRRVVDRRPGRGTIVAVPTPHATELAGLSDDAVELAQVAELRRLLEPQLAGLAAARATDADLVRLDQILADSHAGLTPEESLGLDIAFHVQIATSSGNPLLVTLCTLASGWATDVRRRSHATRRGRRMSVDGHRAIYDAVRAGDQVGAEAAMIDHLDAVAALIASSRDRA